MLLKSMIFTVFACVLTYIVSIKNQEKIASVDMNLILREEAKKLAKQNLSPSALEISLKNVQKEVMRVMRNISKQTGTILITTPVISLRHLDMTPIVMSHLSALRKDDS